MFSPPHVIDQGPIAHLYFLVLAQSQGDMSLDTAWAS